MERREFLKITGLASLYFSFFRCTTPFSSQDFEVEIQNDSQLAHRIFKGKFPTPTKTLHTDYLIVGGGISGLSAAASLPKTDVIICELSHNWGGSSAAQTYQKTSFAQGAHYDISYPDYYGKEGLQLLEKLNIIKFDSYIHQWTFIDKQHLITSAQEERVLENHSFRKDVLFPEKEEQKFVELLMKFSKKTPLPSTSTPTELTHLNHITFLEYLTQHHSFSNEFLHRLDYNLTDDWGAGAATVSALAGIHYYMCRPYYTQSTDIFSPPEGNGYFVKKLKEASQRHQQHLKNTLVYQIKEVDQKLHAWCLDLPSGNSFKIIANKVIYAAHKHALPYIFHPDKELFSNRYAPWFSINFILNGFSEKAAFWQNEYISSDTSFMGFVDSNSQHQNKGAKRVITAYYCLPEKDRKILLNFDNHYNSYIQKTISYINKFYQQKIDSSIEKVFIKVMGHAMPIPTPGYLLQDANEKRSCSHLTYAGVDNHRLPVFFDAMDSGIQATKHFK